MNPLITEISQNLPKPNDFGVGNDEYKSWEDEIKKLKQIPKQYNYTGTFYGAAAFLAGIFLWNISLEDWGAVSGFLILYGLLGMVISGRNYSTEYVRVLDKIRELESKKVSVEYKYSLAKNKYLNEVLNQYKDTYLYRQRTDSYGFSEKLQLYSDTIGYFSDVCNLSAHRDYVNSRGIKVTPYKRPSHQDVNKQQTIKHTASVRPGHTTVASTQEPITEEELELSLESTTDIPPQQVERQFNNSDAQRAFSVPDQEESNMIIGNTGEEAVAEYERNLLQENGKYYLSSRVEVVSKTIGDGLGYDVLSFDQDGNEKFIEVKTTRSNGLTANFSFTRGELNFLVSNPNTAFVYCVFDITKNSPRLKIYPAKQFSEKSFEPVEYRVSVR
jgi:Domain of unknown function (DUF3883)